MPVIRGLSQVKPLAADERERLVKRLADERQRPTPDGPVIFEIPLPQSDRIDVMVLWQEWEPIRSEDRTAIIQEAYLELRDKVAQAIGVTTREAIEEQLLPYAVAPMARPGEVDSHAIQQAMIEEGAFRSPDGRSAELRFPTMAMAEAAHRRLVEKLPKAYWSIVQTAGDIG